MPMPQGHSSGASRQFLARGYGDGHPHAAARPVGPCRPQLIPARAGGIGHGKAAARPWIRCRSHFSRASGAGGHSMYADSNHPPQGGAKANVAVPQGQKDAAFAITSRAGEAIDELPSIGQRSGADLARDPGLSGLRRSDNKGDQNDRPRSNRVPDVEQHR